MTKSSGSVSFRSSRKPGGRKTDKKQNRERRAFFSKDDRDSRREADGISPSDYVHYDEFPFTDTFQGFSSNQAEQPDTRYDGLRGDDHLKKAYHQIFHQQDSVHENHDGQDSSRREHYQKDAYQSSHFHQGSGNQPSFRQTGYRSGQGKRSFESTEYQASRTNRDSSVGKIRNKGGAGDRRKSRAVWIAPIFIILLLLVLTYALIYSAFSKVEKHALDRGAITVNAVDQNMKHYQTIALFGVDNQDNVINERGSRTDSIIVACINNRTKKVRLMSIYRDTYVSIDGKYDKINAAYSYGGPEQALNTINRNLDLNITDFATVNFKALADAVDILGGIPLTIQSKKELKNLNDYIGNMNKINGGDSPKFKKTGTYTFDGNQAVAYSRIRYMEGGDHARASHQRLVVEGILKKAKSQPWKMQSLISKVLPQCKTSFSTGAFTRMAMGLALYDIEDSQAYPFDSFDEKYEGIYYGFPTTVASNVKQAHKYLYGTEDYEPTDELKKISSKVKDISDMVQ